MSSKRDCSNVWILCVCVYMIRERTEAANWTTTSLGCTVVLNSHKLNLAWNVINVIYAFNIYFLNNSNNLLFISFSCKELACRCNNQCYDILHVLFWVCCIYVLQSVFKGSSVKQRLPVCIKLGLNTPTHLSVWRFTLCLLLCLCVECSTNTCYSRNSHYCTWFCLALLPWFYNNISVIIYWVKVALSHKESINTTGSSNFVN